MEKAEKQLITATAIATVFMVGEVVGGYIANSLAVLTDAAHLVSDLAGFGISLFSLHLAKRRSTALLSFGFKRSEVIGALLSVFIIWVVTLFLLLEAVAKTRAILERDPAFVRADGKIMTIVASLGLFCNVLIMYVLGGEAGHMHSHLGTSHHQHAHSHGDSSSSSPRLDRVDEENQTLIGKRSGDAISTSNKTGNTGDDEESEEEDEEEEIVNGLKVKYRHVKRKTSSSTGTSVESMGTRMSSSSLPIKKRTTNNGYGTLPPTTIEEEEEEEEEEEYHGHSHNENLGDSHHHNHSHHNLRHTASESHDDATTDEKPNINISAAYVHALGDLLQSVGVLLAGLVIWWFPDSYRAQLADPITTFVFGLIVIVSTVQVVRRATHVLMEGIPEGLDAFVINQALTDIPNVASVHDLHVWSLSMDEPFLTVHLMMAQGASHEAGIEAMASAHELLKRRFGISHATVQLETDNSRCLDERLNQACHSYAHGGVTRYRSISSSLI